MILVDYVINRVNRVENKSENLLAWKMQKVGVEGYRITAPFCHKNILQ